MNRQYFLYVDVNGNDSGSGSLKDPFATLRRAQAEVRARRDSLCGITVYVRTGEYHLSETLRFTAEDSGTEDGQILYAAYPGEAVTVSGGFHLEELNWRAVRNGIYMSPVKKGMSTDQLYIDGRQYVMARYPNFSKDIPIFNSYAADCLSEERTAGWNDPEGGFVHAMHSHMWGGYHYLITGKNDKGEVGLEGGWQNNRQMGMHDKYRYVENIFEELDAPGEWYLDQKTNMLYVYPYPGTDLEHTEVVGVRLKHLVEIAGTEEAPVKHISFRGFTFKHTTRTFMDTREPLLRSDWTIYRGGAVLLKGTEDCTVEHCHFDNLGGNAVFVSDYNRRAKVKSCHISDVGASGVAFVGSPEAVRNPLFEYHQRQSIFDLDMTPGPQTNGYPSDCLVEDCLIYRSGRVEKQSAPVQISMAMNITVRHCSIYEVPRAGINISEGTWGGHVIEYCDVFDTVLETGDHGSFNSWGRDRYWRLTEFEPDTLNAAPDLPNHPLPILDMVKPNIIRNNRWSCDYGWDIDLDDGSSHYHIYNNLCLSGGIKLREGFYRICENNITVNNSIHVHVWYKGSRDILRRNIIFNPYHPIRVSAPWGKECDWNLLHTPGEAVPESAVILKQQSGRDEHSLTADALFLNPQEGDYRVSDNSPAAALGFTNFPMDRFGVTSPELKSIARTPKLPEFRTSVTESTRSNQIVSWERCKIKNVVGMGDISAYGLPEEAGAIVISLPLTSWQHELGLRAEDVIIEWNGQSIGDTHALLEQSRLLDQNPEMKLTLYRGQQKIQIVGIKCR